MSWIQEVRKCERQFKACNEITEKHPEFFKVSGEYDSFKFIADINGDGSKIVTFQHGVYFDRHLNPEYTSREVTA